MTPEEYDDAATPAATLRSLDLGWRSWVSWCTRTRGAPLYVDDVTPTALRRYIAEMAATVRPSTIAVYLSAIRRHCRDMGRPDPTLDREFQHTWTGIRREHHAGHVERAPAFLAEHIHRAVYAILGDLSPHMRRDRAALLLGWHGALRASELVGLRWEDVERDPHGCILTIRRSKRNQETPERVGIPCSDDVVTCPIIALSELIEVSGGGTWVFHECWGQTFRAGPMTTRAVSRIVQRAAHLARLPLPGRFSSHSLRAGCATSMHLAGVDSLAIQKHLRHLNLASTGAYLRDPEMRFRPTRGLL